MEYSKELSFATVLRNKPIDTVLLSYFTKAYNKNLKIFEEKPKYFKIIICDTEKDFKYQSKRYYQKWSSAVVLGNLNLVVRNSESIEKHKIWKKKDYPNIINHEMNHVFWLSLYKKSKPIWLTEGLACYVGKNFILNNRRLFKVLKEYEVNPSILEYRYMLRNFENGHYPRYPVWACFADFLIKKKSIKTVIRFMRKYAKNPRSHNYKTIFRKMFGGSDKELFVEFINRINQYY